MIVILRSVTNQLGITPTRWLPAAWRCSQAPHVDLTAFVGDTRRNRGKHIVRNTGPIGGHGVFGGNRTKHDRRTVGTLVALHAHGMHIGKEHDRHCQISRSRPALESSSRAMASASRSRSRRSLVISPMMRMPSPGQGTADARRFRPAIQARYRWHEPHP